MSLSPEESYDEDVQALAEEIAVRTPERQAYMDYACEVRQIQGDTTEAQKARLEKLLKKADDADNHEKLIESGRVKLVAYAEKTIHQIRTLAVVLGEVPEAVERFDALVKGLAAYQDFRVCMGKDAGAISEELTPQGKALELERRTHSLELRMNEHFLGQNQMALRRFLNDYRTSYSTIYGSAWKEVLKRVGGKVANDLAFAADLLRNPDAKPRYELIVETRVGATEQKIAETKAEHEDYLREVFGGALSHYVRDGETRRLQRSTPERVALALKEAQSIATGGRTETRDKFEEAYKTKALNARYARSKERNAKVLDPTYVTSFNPTNATAVNLTYSDPTNPLNAERNAKVDIRDALASFEALNAGRNAKVADVALKGRERSGTDLMILRHNPFYGLIHLVVIGFLVWAFDEYHEDEYYILLRFIVAAFFIGMAFLFIENSKGKIDLKYAKTITFGMFGLAALYNPFVPLELGWEIWKIVNVITILLIGSMLWRYDLFTHHSQR